MTQKNVSQIFGNADKSLSCVDDPFAIEQASFKRPYQFVLFEWEDRCRNGIILILKRHADESSSLVEECGR
jgi:hypothetical protein